jgi:DNA-binding transcriptional regulator GbsR (MarR family)
MNMSTGYTEQQQQFIEETSLYFEGLGLTRMAGRIVGLLLICSPPHQSMTDMVEALNASKSTISTSLKELLRFFLIERFAVPGVRRDYYKLADDIWYRSFEARMSGITEIRKLAERGLAVLPIDDKQKRQRLELMRDMYEFMEREFPKLLQKWDDEKRAKGYE